jgi:hypothetical protein
VTDGRRRAPFAALILLLGAARGAAAGEMGHYVAGSWSPRDLLAAPSGLFAVATFGAVYSADRARTGDGTRVGGDGGLYVGAESWAVTPVIVYAPEEKVLGADWSMIFMAAYGEAGANARLTAFDQSITLFDNNRTALGDTYFVPATLTWSLNPALSLSAQYALWIPTGSYDAGRADNVGLGYWSHNLRGTVSWFPLGNPAVLVSASVVHEVNSRKKGFDLRPAPHTALELGFSMATSERFMFGVVANGQWETGDASGAQAAEDGRDRLFSAGGEATYWFKPGRLGGMVRYLQEFAVRDRFEGRTLVAGLNVIF